MITEQRSFSDLRWPAARQSHLRRLLDRLDLAIDFSVLVAELQPSFPGPGRGRRPWPLPILVRLATLAVVFGWNPRQAEDALIDVPAICAWCGLDDSKPRPPDSETIAGFMRKLAILERQDAIADHLRDQLAAWNLHLAPGSQNEPRLHGRDL
ncbi:transposase [Accumulibacter sp.]|uniref:transposase n=1 Tax=Accumulibacter sp. TaxID=2053492 RepID=UPI001A5597C5|nr:transposase [Accumulibacter sp.]MBL8373792.1 transposase [Accumulibacter sp.]